VRSGLGIGIVARSITGHGPLGAAFQAVDLDAAPGNLVAVTGPGGSGRTSLLLAIAGRFPLVAGELLVGGHRLPRESSAVRRLVAVARARPAIDLDERLLVRELVAERPLLGGRKRSASEESVIAALRLVGIDPPRDALVGELHPAEQTLLACALAIAENPPGIVVDDVDEGLEPGDRPWVWRALRTVAGTGRTVVASASAPPSDPVAADQVVRLTHRSALHRAALARAERMDPLGGAP
jgi:ABC-2 type transport system ATP-binding protein